MDQAQWWQRAVFYQIYPRSFADSDGDGIGDLPGITSRLDHLRDGPASLGVDAIWLCPFYPSPMVDFGYDISDYCSVDPIFGTLDDFDDLLNAAHRRNLRVIIDLVPNHTSDRHPWFTDSRSALTSDRRDWYLWADPATDGGPPNNWLSCFAATGSAWTLDEATGQYYLHSYTRHQPDLNWRNPAVRQAFAEVMRFWLDRGVDGFRIDVPHRLIKDQHLRDNPPELAGERRALTPGLTGHRNLDQPDVHEVVRFLRRVLDAYPDRVIVGEVGVADPRRLARYYGVHDELHLAFSFPFWSQPWAAGRFRETIAELEQALPDRAWPTYALSNHDLPRAATRYDIDRHGTARARLAAMMLLTVRGTPFLYYGEEIGMTDLRVSADDAGDPNGRDGCRAPMRWDNGPHYGFSSTTPWIHSANRTIETTVADQRADPASLLSTYRDLLALRRAHPALTIGDYLPLEVGDQVFAYERRTREERLLIALNFGATPTTVLLPQTAPGAVRLYSTSRPGEAVTSGRLRLDSHEGVVLRAPDAGQETRAR